MRGAAIQRRKSCRNRTGHFIKLISVADNESLSAFTWTPGLELMCELTPDLDRLLVLSSNQTERTESQSNPDPA